MAKTATKEPDKFEHAKQNARGWLETIDELLGKLGNDEHSEDARREIEESALSVLVRDGWHAPGQLSDDGAEKYKILLSTGGPALHIRGELDKYNQPANAVLEIQDWFTPWTPYDSTFGLTDKQNEQLLEFARQFYFGE